jgi:hypothetical protein
VGTTRRSEASASLGAAPGDARLRLHLTSVASSQRNLGTSRTVRSQSDRKFRPARPCELRMARTQINREINRRLPDAPTW